MKLDAGSEEYYQKVNISKISHRQIVSNIKQIGARYPLTLQTLFFKLKGQGPSEDEIEKYNSILSNLLKDGLVIEEIQLHSISRKPSQDICNSLEKSELETIAAKIKSHCDVTINVY